MKIEEMRSCDLDAVRALATQLGYECTEEEIDRRFDAIRRLPSHKLFVARDGGTQRVVGWIHLTIETLSLLGELRADVSGLVVDESYRGGGVGSKLLNAGEAWAQAQGLDLVRVRTNTKRELAHRFYEKSGYELKKSWHLYIKGI